MVNDTTFLNKLIKNIHKGIAELNEFESEVLARSNTGSKQQLIDEISLQRNKLSTLAASVVISDIK